MVYALEWGCWVMEKAREFQKNIYFCFIDYAKAFDCVDHNKLRKILKEMGIPDHLICLLRNLYAGQEATVRTGHGTTDWFQIGKGVHQGCILSPCLFNFYAEYIMRNAWLEEAQAGINIPRRNINNLRYADDTTHMAESEEELNRLLMKVKEESEKVGLKLNIEGWYGEGGGRRVQDGEHRYNFFKLKFKKKKEKIFFHYLYKLKYFVFVLNKNLYYWNI